MTDKQAKARWLNRCQTWLNKTYPKAAISAKIMEDGRVLVTIDTASLTSTEIEALVENRSQIFNRGASFVCFS